ncbi:RNA polymerase sigma factor [Desulfomonile tiedjei]|uniref:RNA polymerase sigma factor, sigma-70 family n=1 Tax=Desulfomonile tiedjei (strain ATCC 49306 / DSM 6799 / DCB-1) TaxID=706587 RepID=I4C3V2_DESTA|nr:RNA polymerase sigma factor [Desulfomonile tiedjei]AFM24243.1 RNA polymerase sigma factor, sigma-70 family [Desulfomonile tiedjei DSM 6799]
MSLYGKTPDIDLVQECLKGSQTAWNEFYTRFLGLVKNIVRRNTGSSPQDIEDLTQSAFLELASALKSFVPGNSLTGFICTVAQRVAVDEFRKTKASKRDARTEPVDHHDGEDENSTIVISNSVSQDRQLERAQLAAQLRRALTGLDPRCRELIELRYMQELPFSEVSQLMGATENTVTVQTKRCLDKLKTAYKDMELRGTSRENT